MNYDKREKVADMVAKMNPKSMKAKKLAYKYKLDLGAKAPVVPIIPEVVEPIVEEVTPKKTSKKKA